MRKKTSVWVGKVIHIVEGKRVVPYRWNGKEWEKA